MEENPKANNQIEEINVVLNELKDGQELFSNQSQKNFKEIMKKLMKMQEYNEISDMTIKYLKCAYQILKTFYLD